MSKTIDTLDWLRPFHAAAGGRTTDALDLAMAARDAAPDAVIEFAVREGFRHGFHALHRRDGIRVNGDPDTMPLFVATLDEAGEVVHLIRPQVVVAEIDTQITYWGNRRSQADHELVWWTHQRELAERAEATPAERLVDVWDRLGVAYEIVTADDSEATA